MTVVMTAIVSSMTAANPENGLAMAFTVVMLAGVFPIFFGIFKLGKYSPFSPKPDKYWFLTDNADT
ncbi:Sulfate permease or related transporter, MFS superfamily (plasmid) [Nostoc flagelliforme CCNUN1]|uniref:Sulfate permease or related transporter, MFS superfamily n=1 Tax=Nostoc flagelliforme CCNUN1 TaxID=2038116 RepID=A0A2K8TAT7_9NOSO|nr:Sulfate permease or related transporter, MFS superfamily [Nostoc flagelliforme CCNUN1]